MFLLHYWSLGVEMQFYVVVPFLLTMKRLTPSHAIKLLLCAVALSKAFETCQSSESETFGFLEGRLWQFVIGVGVYAIQKSTSTTKLVTSRSDAYVIQPLTKHEILLTRNGNKVNRKRDQT